MLTAHNIDIQAMLVWLTLPFYDFCGFPSVAVNIVYKLQFFTFTYINADLTPAEALAAVKARERRQARRSAETESTPTSRSVTNSASSTVVLQGCLSVPRGETVPCT